MQQTLFATESSTQNRVSRAEQPPNQTPQANSMCPTKNLYSNELGAYELKQQNRVQIDYRYGIMRWDDCLPV